ncbi:LRP1 [Branchiostoma lanceolatum]|uniref:LRP1 protein n=1 Tax=Branchiostoma lanceolatum TaxID=7740 RepID=A0A8K0E886_BRALA|nr:LRP1 [Branchiostoma lanceolatum]
MTVLSDRATSGTSVESILLADLRDGAIYKVNSATGSNETLPFGPLSNPVAVDYDATSDYVYWTDSADESVMRGYLNGTGKEAIATINGMTPDGLALDIPGGNVYWTDTGRDVISVARMDGKHFRNVLSTELDEPRAIVLDPENGYMYWTDWGAQAKIERAAMDGTGRTTLINTGLVWPNGITLDKTAQRLYWCDARTYKIESSDLNGYDRRQFTFQLVHFFGIAVDDTHVYWTAWNVPSVVR